MKDEELAEEYLQSIEGDDCVIITDREERKQAFLAGLKAGRTQMNNIIRIYKHEITGAYLNLNMNKIENEYIINISHITHIEFQADYENGDGEKLARLIIHTINSKITLYREDADEVWKQFARIIKESE